MVDDPNLFWFGCVLWSVSVLVIFNLVGFTNANAGDRVNLDTAYPVKYAYVIDTDEETKIEELRQECLRLREKLEQQSNQLKADFRNATFQDLQTLLTN